MEEKYELLKEILKKEGKVAIAFSGGIDSTFLLDTAVKTLGKENVLSLSVISPFLPEQDIRDIDRYIKKSGIKYVKIKVDTRDNPEIRNNHKLRCYYCKKEMFKRMKEEALKKGFNYIADGTNKDDTKKYRPGLKAKEEEGIKSPLSDIDLNKEEIRLLAKKYGVPYALKPSSSCLATRIPYNTEITDEALKRIDMAEQELKALGFNIVRVRDHGEEANIELGKKDLEKYREIKKERIEKLIERAGYKKYKVDTVPFISGRRDTL